MTPFKWPEMHVVRWRGRGVGMDFNVACFVCGATSRNTEPGTNHAMNNIACHLRPGDEARALACFPRGAARMAHYHGDPDSPQIKVGACDAHVNELQRLNDQWFIAKPLVDSLIVQGQQRVTYERAAS